MKGIANSRGFFTCFNCLKYVEEEKRAKYEVLMNELKSIYGYKGRVLSFVIALNGVTTKYNRAVCSMLGITERVRGYIQYVALLATQQAVNRSYDEPGLEEYPEVEKDENLE